MTMLSQLLSIKLLPIKLLPRAPAGLKTTHRAASAALVLLLPFDMEMHCLSFIVNESTAICNMNAFIVKHVQHIRNQFGRKSVM